MKSILTSLTKQAAALVLCCAIAETTGLSSASAASATASGPSALAVAAVVAAHGSVLGAFDRRALSRMFDGKGVLITRVNKITVAADSITCKTSNVDITQRSCDLTFKTHKRTITGRDANEVFATLTVAGVMPEGAAGTIAESVMNLECTIDPAGIKQKDGSGAMCTFDTGQ